MPHLAEGMVQNQNEVEENVYPKKGGNSEAISKSPMIEGVSCISTYFGN